MSKRMGLDADRRNGIGRHSVRTQVDCFGLEREGVAGHGMVRGRL